MAFDVIARLGRAKYPNRRRLLDRPVKPGDDSAVWLKRKGKALKRPLVNRVSRETLRPKPFDPHAVLD